MTIAALKAVKTDKGWQVAPHAGHKIVRESTLDLAIAVRNLTGDDLIQLTFASADDMFDGARATYEFRRG